MNIKLVSEVAVVCSLDAALSPSSACIQKAGEPAVAVCTLLSVHCCLF